MTRLLSGVAMIAVAIAAILFLPVLALRAVACVVAALAANEYLRVTGWRVPAGAGLAPAGAVIACWLVSGDPADALLALLLGLGIVGFEVLAKGRAIEAAAVGASAVFYIGVPLGLLAAVHASGGANATLLLIATVVVSDSAQYYSGRLFGRRPLAPAISPNKTVEGALGGLLVATLFVAFAGPRAVPGAPPAAWAALGAALVALGICGDLFESRLKRTAGVKDSSALIPGHGGVLDRIDALLFVTPAFYLFLRGIA